MKSCRKLGCSMTKHDDRLYLGHMLDMTIKARRFTHGMTIEQLSGDEVMQHSLVNVLQILGEAARRVSPEGKERFPTFLGLRSLACVTNLFTTTWTSTM